MLFRSASWVLLGALILMPGLLLTTASGGSISFYAALLAGGVILLGTRPSLASYGLLLSAAFAPLAATLLSSALHGELAGSTLERGLRLALGLPLILAALLTLPGDRTRLALWGVLAAGWAGAAHLWWLAGGDFGQRPVTGTYNAVGYGNLMLLLAVIALLSLRLPLGLSARAESAIKLLTALIAFTAFVLTQSRTGWLAVPVFALLALLLYFPNRRQSLHLSAALPLVLATLLAVGALNPALRHRTAEAITQYQQCSIEPTGDTSICIRLQLWRASWHMLQAQPLQGVGARNFSSSLQAQAAEGRVSPYVAEHFGEAHNDFFDTLARYGLPGGLALLLLYAAPALLFLRRLQSARPAPARAAAAMGAAVCLGFAIFGLTELMFRGMRTLGFYIVLLALFAALSDPQRNMRRDTEP